MYLSSLVKIFRSLSSKLSGESKENWGKVGLVLVIYSSFIIPHLTTVSNIYFPNPGLSWERLQLPSKEHLNNINN